jgi:hypothetical protein
MPGTPPDQKTGATTCIFQVNISFHTDITITCTLDVRFDLFFAIDLRQTTGPSSEFQHALGTNLLVSCSTPRWALASLTLALALCCARITSACASLSSKPALWMFC